MLNNFEDMIRSLLFLLAMCHISLSAEVLDIGIYRTDKIKQAVVAPSIGSYEVFGDGKKLADVYPNDGIRVYEAGGKVGVRSIQNDFGSFSKVVFVRKNWGNVFRIRPTQPAVREGKYNDNLVVTISAGHLKLINRVYLEHYVGGVVEAESGSKQNIEYYKLQSIVCRTYALNNLRRHEDEGFHLCDQVHCQVYHGTSRFTELIPEAVSATKGQVVVDSNIDLVTAAFHSNCGGQTIPAEHVWSKRVPYLQSVRDTFCLEGKHARWETRIPRHKWVQYMRTRQGAGRMGGHGSLDFNEADQREVYYASSDSEIHLKEIRRDWNLKSTFFRIEEDEQDVLILGRGFGHGVGMCQEGAMRMSEIGYSHADIIHFYYKDVHIIDLSVLDFFREH